MGMFSTYTLALLLRTVLLYLLRLRHHKEDAGIGTPSLTVIEYSLVNVRVTLIIIFMKVECLREKLRAAVLKASRLVGRNLALPVLSALYLEAKEGKITIRATNLDVGIEVAVPGKIEKNGVAVVSAALLSGFLATKASGEMVTLSLSGRENGDQKTEDGEGNKLFLQSGSHHTMIKCLPSDDFPTLPRMEESISLTLSGDDLRVGIESVVYAASPSDMKPEIASVYIVNDGKELVFVATDSFRLAEKRLLIRVEGECTLLVPHKNASELIRALEGVESQVELAFSKNQLVVTAENLYFTSRLVEGVYIDYAQIMPNGSKTEVVVLKEDLIEAMRLSVVFSDKFNPVVLTIDPDEKLFEVRAHGAETGESTTRLAATIEGEKVEMGFNARYILEAFASIQEDSVALTWNGAGRPMLMRGTGNKSFSYLVMPMNR